MTIGGVVRELLVRYLDTWTPAALHAGKRATFALAWSESGGLGDEAGTGEAALRVFAEFDDMLRTRRLGYVLVGPDAETVRARLDAVTRELGSSPNLALAAVDGPPGTMLPVALSAAGTAGAPLLVCVRAATPVPVRAGRGVEVLAVMPAGVGPARGVDGFPLETAVELDDGAGNECLVSFATASAKSLEAFKNALWAVDEYAGVRYRDPRDPQRRLLDISLDPSPGPLRRALLAHLAEVGPRTVTQLRHYTLTDTVYRASDATKAMTGLLHTGTITTDATRGRLTGDVTVTLAHR
jgi:hypothetical protein